jgi:hypothetical protein
LPPCRMKHRRSLLGSVPSGALYIDRVTADLSFASRSKT